MTKKDIRTLPVVERAAIKMTESVGSPASLVLHTLGFIVIFGLSFFGVSFEDILLILTTVVSLEAIYLAIFIQMTVNRNTHSLEEVEEDIEEIQKDVDEIQEDVDEIQKDVDEIQEDVDEVQKDIDSIEEDMEEIHEEDESDEERDQRHQDTLVKVESTLMRLIEEIEKIKKNSKQ